MDQVARLPLGGRRYQAYAKTLRFVGVDLTGASFRMQVRMLPNTPGAPLLALETVASGAAEGIRLIGVEQVNGQPVSTIGIRVNKTSMQALPYAGELGDDSAFAYDLMVNPAGGLEQVWLAGDFVAQAGVTGADNAAVAFSSGAAGRSIGISAGAASFQVGDTVVVVTIGPGEGPPGGRGPPGAAGNVAAGRDALFQVTAIPGDVWFLSAGNRSGNFVYREGATPADALEGIFIPSLTANRYWARIWDGITGYPEWFGAAPNDGATDSLPAIVACMALCPVTQLANADYFTRATWHWSSAYSKRRVYGVEGSYEGQGFGTRVILTGAQATAGATILHLGDTVPPAWNTAGVLYRPILEGVCLVRDGKLTGRAGSFVDQPKGMIASYMLEGHFRRLKVIGNIVGIHVFGCVNTEFEHVHVHRGNGGATTPDNDDTCHFLVGAAQPIFGFAGANATLHFRRCTASGNSNGKSNTRAMMLFGCYVDTFIANFEMASMPYGIVLDGTDLNGNNVVVPSGQGDVWIDHPILDQVSNTGLTIYRQNIYGSIDVVAPYVAPVGTGFGINIYESTGSTRIVAGQVLGSGASTGLTATSSQGLHVKGLDCRDCLQPLSLTAVGASDIDVIARNLSVKAGAAFALVGCYRMKLSGIVTGNAAMFDSAAWLTGNSNFVHVDPSAYNPGAFTTVTAANKVMFNGQDASVGAGRTDFEAAGCRLSGVLG